MSAVCIAVATLTPGNGGSNTTLCLFCGQRGFADFLSNVVLFAPLGLALALIRGSMFKAIAAGALFSIGIEAAQVAIVYGRDANIGDVLANSLGTAAGWMLAATRDHWVSQTAAGTKVAGWTATVLTALLVGLWLFTPALPDVAYYLQWTARFGDMEPYEGRVLSSRMGPLNLAGPPWRIPQVDSVRALIESGAPAEISFVAGPPPSGQAPIVSIGDIHGREVLFIGANGTDLTHRYRTRADEWKLDRGDLRMPGALRDVVPGSEVKLVLKAGRDNYCYQIGPRSDCGPGFTVGDTWGLLMSPDWSGRAQFLMQMLWLFCLFLPSGFLAGAVRHALLAAAALTGVLVAGPYLIGFAVTPALQIAVAIAGVSSGFGVRMIIQRGLRNRSVRIRRDPASEFLAA